MQIKFCIGLGNIGAEFENSPHNLGYMMLDMITQGKPCKAKTQTIWVRDKLILSKPLTYMNRSGNAVRELLDRSGMNKLDFVRSLMVLHDDINLNMHKISYKDGAVNPGSGGHNGLRSIVDALCMAGLTKEQAASFHRVRIGCKPESDVVVRDYVTRPMQADLLAEWRLVLENWRDELLDLLSATTV